MPILSRAVSATFLVAFVLFIVASNVRLAFFSLPLYEFGFSRHRVDLTTGLTREQLSDAARQIRDYFFDREELLDVRVTVGGARMALFDEREISHMRDVKALALGVFRVQEGALLYMALVAAIGLFLRGRDFAALLRRLFIMGSLLLVAMVTAVGVASLIMFGPLFFMFHLVSFANDLWQLDPESSYLIRMFPLGFWQETTLLIGAASIVEGLAVVFLFVAVRKWQEWRRRLVRARRSG